MQKEWISTPELLAYLKWHRDDEVECRLYLGNGIGSTHYWYWDSQSRLYAHSRLALLAVHRAGGYGVLRRLQMDD